MGAEGCDTSGNLVRSGRNQLEIIGNQLEITEIWLEIRNQDPVEIRKSARNHKKSSRNNEKHPPFCLSMRSRPFAHAHLRNPREIRVTKAGNQLEISWKSVGNHSEGGKSVGNHRNPEISYAEKACVVPLDGSAIAIFETKPIYQKRQIYSGASTILSP